MCGIQQEVYRTRINYMGPLMMLLTNGCCNDDAHFVLSCCFSLSR